MVKNGTYGTATWMSEKEMQEELEVTTPEKAEGTILGEYKGKMCIRDRSRIDADSDARHHSNCCNGSNTHASCSPVRYGYRRRFLISVLGSYMQVWNSQTKTSYEKGGIQI